MATTNRASSKAAVRFVDVGGYVFLQLSQSFPEHHAEDDMRPEPQITRDDAFIESVYALLPERFGHAFQVRRVHLPSAFSVHRLVVESGGDQIERRHHDSHEDAAQHAAY